MGAVPVAESPKPNASLPTTVVAYSGLRLPARVSAEGSPYVDQMIPDVETDRIAAEGNVLRALEYLEHRRTAEGLPLPLQVLHRSAMASVQQLLDAIRKFPV